jgi:uncharacterized membrane protein YhdT
MMMMIIVIMATTKQQEQQKSLGMWMLNPRLCTSSWFCVLYSKSQMKITQPVSRMYQNHLCSSLDLGYVLLFIFNIRFIFREIPLGFLNSGYLSLLNSLMNAFASSVLRHMILSGLTIHHCFSNKEQYIHFLPFLCENRHFPFSNPF